MANTLDLSYADVELLERAANRLKELIDMYSDEPGTLVWPDEYALDELAARIENSLAIEQFPEAMRDEMREYREWRNTDEARQLLSM